MPDAPVSEKAREAWRAVPFGHGQYLISESGAIARDGRLIKAFPDVKGYLRIVLSDGPRRGHYYVHTLVARCFLGERPDGLHIGHRDGNKTNNHYTNLRYVTPQENENDKLAHGTRRFGERHQNAKLNWDAVVKIRSSDESHVALARRYGVSPDAVRLVRLGLVWKPENRPTAIRAILDGEAG